MKKKNIVISSFATIALCLSLLMGSTFALFTSESKVNIAVTSGKVSVVANIDETSVQTKQLYDTQYEDGKGNMFMGEDVATFTAAGLELNNVVPGDGIKFNIVVKNESTVSVKYRTIISCENDNGLFAGLLVNIADKQNYDGKEHASKWELMSVGAQDIIVPITIELPETAGNTYQGKTCTITYYVQAIQGNAYTGPDAIITRYAQENLPVRTPISGNMGEITFPAAPEQVTVEAAWTFAATDTTETVKDSPYKDWICDFVIECDSKVALGELGLWGAYGGMDFAFANPLELPEGQSLFMMISVGYTLTYEAICTDVKVFDCGVFRGLVDPQMKGKTVTVSLLLINPEYAEKLIEEVSKECPNLNNEDLLLEVMKKSHWESAIGTDVLIANKTAYTFE